MRPAHPAIVDGNRTLTYAELQQSAMGVAADLLAGGIEPGQRVAVIAEPSVDYAVLVHALMKVGAVLAPLDPKAPAPEADRRLQELDAELVVRDPAEAVGGAQGQRPPATDEEILDLEAVQCTIYTSGTGGAPKPVDLTHGNHLWNAIGSALRLDHDHDDRWLMCVPLHHVSGLAILLRGAIGGTTVVIQRGFEADAVYEAIDRHGAKLVSLVPTMLKRLLEEGNSTRLRKLRVALVGGGPLVPSLREWAIAEGVPIAPTYGLTEAASQVATLAPHQTPHKHASAGLPLMPTQVRIADDGRIMVKGPTVAPAEVDEHGWLRTGDLGAMDAGGFLYFLGRADNVIVTGGENVSPEEVERTLFQRPDVEDAAVFGREHPEWQAAVTARVVLVGGVKASDALKDELIEFCKARLPSYKAPKEIEFASELPRDAIGKLLRRKC